MCDPHHLRRFLLLRKSTTLKALQRQQCSRLTCVEAESRGFGWQRLTALATCWASWRLWLRPQGVFGLLACGCRYGRQKETCHAFGDPIHFDARRVVERLILQLGG